MQINFKLKFSKQEDSVLIAIVCLLGIIHSFMYIDTMKGSLFEEYYFIAHPLPHESLRVVPPLPRESLRVVLQFKILKNTNIV